MNSAFLYASRLSNKKDKGPLGRMQLFDSPSEVQRKVSILRDALRTSEFAVVHSGAGVSTASGISDFRGPSGIWTVERATGRRLAVESDCTLRDKGLIVQYGTVVREAVDIWLALPSRTHIIIAKLVSKGKIKHVITQNVDRLHICCGLKFSQISELHGNLFVEACEICGRRFLRDFVIPSISFRPSGHFCGLCGFPPVGVCTDVVLDWFDSYDPLYEERAIRFSKIADLHLCLGSSLAIQPACEYPSVECHRRQDSSLFIVNYQSTPLDDEATQVIHDDVNKIAQSMIESYHTTCTINTLCVDNKSSKRPRRAAAERSTLNMEMINKYGKSLKEWGSTTNTNGVGTTDIKSENNSGLGIGCTDSVKRENNKSEVGDLIGTAIKREDCSEDFSGNSSNNSSNNNKCSENGTYAALLEDAEIYCDKSVILTILRLPINSPKDLYYVEFLPILKNAEHPDPIYPSMEWRFSPKSSSKGQTFFISSAAITAISGVEAKLVDRVRGLWVLEVTDSVLINLDLWYGTSIYLKLIYDAESAGMTGNSFECIVAYTDGKGVPNITKSCKTVEFSTSIVEVKGYSLSFNGHLADKDSKKPMELITTLDTVCNIEGNDKCTGSVTDTGGVNIVQDDTTLSPVVPMQSFILLYNAYSLVCKHMSVSGTNLPEPSSHGMAAQPFFRLALKNFSELSGNKPVQLAGIPEIRVFPSIKVKEDHMGELVSDDAPLKAPPKKRRFTTSCFMKKNEKMSKFETLIANYIYRYIRPVDSTIEINGEFSDQLLGEIIARIPLWTINYLTDLAECR